MRLTRMKWNCDTFTRGASFGPREGAIHIKPIIISTTTWFMPPSPILNKVPHLGNRNSVISKLFWSVSWSEAAWWTILARGFFWFFLRSKMFILQKHFFRNPWALPELGPDDRGFGVFWVDAYLRLRLGRMRGFQQAYVYWCLVCRGCQFWLTLSPGVEKRGTPYHIVFKEHMCCVILTHFLTSFHAYERTSASNDWHF